MPTGTVMGSPVSMQRLLRTRPSVEDMEMQRTVSSPVCWATSTMMWLPSSLSTLMALFRLGSSPWSKRMSTTGPMTWMILPSLLIISPSYSAFAVPTISVSSCVIAAWRAWLNWSTSFSSSSSALSVAVSIARRRAPCSAVLVSSACA